MCLPHRQEHGRELDAPLRSVCLLLSQVSPLWLTDLLCRTMWIRSVKVARAGAPGNLSFSFTFANYNLYSLITSNFRVITGVFNNTPTANNKGTFLIY